jgi:hypothetical protein
MPASITIEGLEEMLASIERRLAAIEAQLAQPQGPTWFDTKAAAVYLSTTPEAVRSAEKSGHIVATRSRSGRVLFSKEALDGYAMGG